MIIYYKISCVKTTTPRSSDPSHLGTRLKKEWIVAFLTREVLGPVPAGDRDLTGRQPGGTLLP